MKNIEKKHHFGIHSFFFEIYSCSFIEDNPKYKHKNAK